MKSELFLDFEFNQIVEAKVNLVCCATFDPATNEKRNFWLHKNPANQKRLKEYLKKYTLVIAYSAIAECRSFMSLGLDPLKFEWEDLFLEYRMMTNHNDKLQWGEQLVDGKIKKVRKPRPKWERTEEDKASGFKATHSLAECTFKLTGKVRDTEQKTKMRNLIISAPKDFSMKYRKAIMAYCMEDVVFLPSIRKRIREEFKSMFTGEAEKMLDMKEYAAEARLRGRYAAHTSIMESRGYPIDVEKTKQFSKQVGTILWEQQREINRLFPTIKPFKWNKKEQRYSWDQTITKDWIRANHDPSGWMKTDGGDLALSLDAFQRFYDFKHDYPEHLFGAQIVKFLKLKQSLYGFAPSSSSKGKSSRKTFWDSVGSDGRVRPYMNIYGAQSSRSQPGATGFMFLKPAWMRALVVPAKNKFMASIDYGAQEFFVSGLESGDQNMIDAYLSGDPYFYQAKLSGAVPKDAKKEDHKAVRDLFKATTLGISYGMTKFGLAIKLTNDTGKEWDEDDAQEQIDTFYENFENLKDYQDELREDYEGGGAFIKLPCGWYFWGDNDNHRSVGNVPIQGFGGSVMRLAVDLAVQKGIYVCKTLHDALYMEDDCGNEHKIAILRDCMREAFVHYVEPKYKKYAEQIRLDPYAWSPNYKPDSTMKVGKEKWEIPVSNLYVDERSLNDYNRFSKYFEQRDEDNL